MTELKFKTPRRTYRRNVSQGAGCVAMVVFLILAVGALVVLAALAVGAANAWILEGNFVDGWHKSWERWPVTLGWSLVASFLVVNSNSSSD